MEPNEYPRSRRAGRLSCKCWHRTSLDRGFRLWKDQINMETYHHNLKSGSTDQRLNVLTLECCLIFLNHLERSGQVMVWASSTADWLLQVLLGQRWYCCRASNHSWRPLGELESTKIMIKRLVINPFLESWFSPISVWVVMPQAPASCPFKNRTPKKALTTRTTSWPIISTVWSKVEKERWLFTKRNKILLDLEFNP